MSRSSLPPGVAWVPVETALDRLRAATRPVPEVETVPLLQAGGRILAAPLHAARANPPAANAAVDGYGFAHASLGPAPHALALLPGRAAAGAPYTGAVPPGHALRILTGALLPAGVDTVLIEELVTPDADAIHFERTPRPRANTRPAGEDVGEGAEILPEGRRLAPQDLALAAAAGLGALAVRRRLRVAVLSTGDELRAPGTPAAPHQTYDANRPMLLDILRRWDMIPVDLGHAPDSAEAVTAALDRGAAEADAILTSGGASAGDEDHVSAVLKARGALETWRIAVKPGRPLAIGRWQGRPVFGLPGNPVAAFVCTLDLRPPRAPPPRRRALGHPARPHPPGGLRQGQARRPPRVPARPPRRDGRGGSLRLRRLGAHFRACLGARPRGTGGRTPHDPAGRSGPLPSLRRLRTLIPCKAAC